MHALKDFFSTDYGLLSALVIFSTICLLGWYVRFFLTSIRRDAENARKAEKAQQKAQKAALAAEARA
ncbi:DUF3149 domain-containing protein [Caldimonas tepidiphila]|uniref:DUF3149 domain-containing protein n=1 Tax=Caldimonas tepidiphila TaxID=2315841 RepID=UPI000E5C190C|nr:DUF3149 domain-containing protein [Caldimonas tepidiphila]